MTSEQKETALLKYFSSEEYIREFHENYESFWQQLITAINVFEDNLPEDYNNWPSKERTDIWRERVLSRHTAIKRFEEAIDQHLNGDSTKISGITTNYRVLMTRVSDLMVMKWLDYIDQSYKKKWIASYKIGGIQASNIYRTIEQTWRPGSILKQGVTGPISEGKITKYLK